MLINEYRQYKCHTIMTILDTAKLIEKISYKKHEIMKFKKFNHNQYINLTKNKELKKKTEKESVQ